MSLPPVRRFAPSSRRTQSESASSDACMMDMQLVPPSSSDRSALKAWHVMAARSPRSAQCEQTKLLHHADASDMMLMDEEALAPIEIARGARRDRTINCWTLGFIAYFAVAAGPFGIEDAVSAAGPRLVLLAVVILPFTWGLPQALMTAELSTMIDENGGYILWVQRGLGDFAGWLNAFNSVASNLCDLPTYPVLFCGYVEAFLVSGYGIALTELHRWLVKSIALLLVFAANAFGVRAVALSSVAMSLFVLAPFVLEPLRVETFNLATWGQVAPQIDWPLFLSTILWNYQGWDSLGCVAGEVKDGGRTYPIAIGIAMLLITVNYAFPVAAGIMIEPDFSQWHEGMLETIAMRMGNWLGVWVGVAAVIATLGQFNVVMACSSRAMWATASIKMLPSVLSTEWRRYGTPLAAILFQTCTTAVLMSCSFEFLVVLDTFFNNTSLLLEFMAFLRLKYTEADSPRPFRVPWGTRGAWLITLPKMVVLAGVLLAQDAQVWLYCGVFNVVVAAIYVLWRHMQRADKQAAPVPVSVDGAGAYGSTQGTT